MKEPVYIRTLVGVKRLRKISIGKRQDLSALLSFIYDTMVNYPDNISFRDLYDKDEFFRAACNESVELCGISSDVIDIDTLYALLLPHIDGNGKTNNNGILAQLNFQGIESHNKNSAGEDASIADVLAILWQISGSLKDSLDVLYDDRVTSEILNSAMDRYAKLSNPEEYAKAQAKNKAKQSLIDAQNNPEKHQVFETEEVEYRG